MRFKTNAAPLGDIGMLVITLLKALATPLILFAVLDAFLRTRIPAKKGAKLVAISLLNAAVAVAIGLTIANLAHGGDRWQGHMEELKAQVGTSASGRKDVDEDSERVEGLVDALVQKKVLTKKEAQPRPPSLDPFTNFSRYIPKNLVDPFRRNGIITVVLLAVLAGAALRKLKDKNLPELAPGLQTIENVVRVVFQVFVQMLDWLVMLIPYAVFGIVASVVGKTGPGIFSILGLFLGTIMLGMFIHAVVYYSVVLSVVGRTSPIRFFRGATEAIVTALSTGSSLATLPVTLRCLNDKLKVSPDSARLAACVGTNLNHDGIILYEAAAAVFVAQAFGMHLGVSQQVAIALASVMAGVGIAGVPEAGLITLPLVLSAAGLSPAVVATVIPLILPVDWILGRCRAATNVISDMTVATLLDRLHPIAEPEEVVVPSEGIEPVNA
jgi:Na+/H+-dicarboxylate symporter